MSDRIPADFALKVATGMSDPELGDALGVSTSTVYRWRLRLGLPSRWRPVLAPHGTTAAYRRGCRCLECRDAQAAYQRDYTAAYRNARGGERRRQTA